MKKYILRKTELFAKRFEKLIPTHLKEKVLNLIRTLSDNPYTGKSLGYKFFREKKIEKWRIYFLIYEESLVIYFIDLSDKKLQQKSINKIKKEYKKFKDYL